jgi:hypothetical protein
MVGIVGILLLGSLAWSAVGAFVSAIGAAGAAIAPVRQPPATLVPAVAASPNPTVIVAVAGTPTAAAALAPTPTLVAVTATTAAASPTPAATGRNPWVLLPQPEPGSKVAPGPLVIEARGRGEAPIKGIRLELDGAALSVALEQRSESTWRGSASTRVDAGQHSVRAVVTDAEGRSGSFRWSFAAGP